LCPLYELNLFNSLDLSSNRITSLPNGTFSNLSNLKVLGFGRNNLVRLDSAAFTVMKNTSWIDFSDNQIDAIEPNFFENFPGFTIINFRNNSCVYLFISEESNRQEDFETYFQRCFDNWSGNGDGGDGAGSLKVALFLMLIPAMLIKMMN
jgi:Leucine-rich repeat (LRR) protein